MLQLTCIIWFNQLTLIHVWLILPIYNPWKHQKNKGFLVFSGCIKWEPCPEMVYLPSEFCFIDVNKLLPEICQYYKARSFLVFQKFTGQTRDQVCLFTSSFYQFILIHFKKVIHFCTPWKRLKIKSFFNVCRGYRNEGLTLIGFIVLEIFHFQSDKK